MTIIKSQGQKIEAIEDKRKKKRKEECEGIKLTLLT